MKLRHLSREEVRSIDAIAIDQYGIPGVCLMENAGRGAAEAIVRLTSDHHFSILCGGGNNGGDGFVIARHLELMGREPTIVILADSACLSGDALINWKIAANGGIPIVEASGFDREKLEFVFGGRTCLVDAMLGTGAVGDPRGVLADAIVAANKAPAMRIAIDLPSGLDCDSGQPGTPCFRADHTLTFVSEKRGFSQPEATEFLGTVETISIGAPAHLLRQFLTTG